MSGFLGLLELCGIHLSKEGGVALEADGLAMMSAGLFRTPGGSADVDLEISLKTYTFDDERR